MFKLSLQKEDLERLTDPSTIYQTLKEGYSIHAPFFLWDDEHTPHEMQLQSLTETSFILSAILPSPSWLDSLTQQTAYLLNLRLQRASFFFKTPFLHKSKETLFEFKLPLQMFKMQRRKSVRFPIPKEAKLWISFHLSSLPTVYIKRRLLDLSATGCSFLIQADQQKNYQIGDLLKSVTFEINGRSFHCEAEVKHCQEVNKDLPQGFKVGVLFQKLTAVEKDLLNVFVFQELRKYYTKFVD